MVFRVVFSFILYSVCLLCACVNSQITFQEKKDDYFPSYIKTVEIDLPQFSFCPEGWNETSFDAGKGYVIPYCEPPQFDPNSTTMIPQAPNSANFLPCPSGWQEVEDEKKGVVICEPYPEDGPIECEGIDEAHFPGEAECVRIGTECPDGDWAENLPTDRRRIYVKEGVVSDPHTEGTQLDPFGSINEAITSAGENAIIALSKGTFDEVVELPTGIMLWGACVSETVVRSSQESEAVVMSNYFNTGVRNLQITGQGRGVLVFGPSAQFHIQDVLVKNSQTVGIMVVSGRFFADNLVVKDTHARPTDRGMGRGIEIQSGALAEVSRTVFTNNREVGVYASGIGTELTLADVLVEDTLSNQSNRKSGFGLLIQSGASAEVSRTVFTSNRDTGIFANGMGTKLTLNDVLVGFTLSKESDEGRGFGLEIQSGASAEVFRTVFTNNRASGVFASGSGTKLTLNDVLVSSTLSRQSDRSHGRGLEIQSGASVEVSRSVFTNNRASGVFVNGSGTELILNDVLVGYTLSRQSDGLYGRGLLIQSGASAEVSRTVITNNHEGGVIAYGDGTKLTLDDVLIANTQQRYCATESDENPNFCEGYGGGIGLGSFGGAHIEMTRFVVSRNAQCGVQLAFGLDKHGQQSQIGGELDLFYGIISHNDICGINVQTENVDLDVWSDTVFFFENNYNNLDTAYLLTPD